jgi:hypothetical protein
VLELRPIFATMLGVFAFDENKYACKSKREPKSKHTNHFEPLAVDLYTDEQVAVKLRK